MSGQLTSTLHSRSTTGEHHQYLQRNAYLSRTLVRIRCTTPVLKGQVAELNLGGHVAGLAIIGLIEVERNVDTVEVHISHENIPDLAVTAATCRRRDTVSGAGPRFEVHL
jgi:capsular polysaccharide biosynthesis protein